MKYEVEERLNVVLITLPRMELLRDNLPAEFLEEVEKLQEKYGKLRFLSFCQNPRDFNTTALFEKVYEEEAAE